jgi:hypothetical protein
VGLLAQLGDRELAAVAGRRRPPPPVWCCRYRRPATAIKHPDGWRYQCLGTDTGTGQPAFLDTRHRAHARVEDRIRCGKDTGLGRFPSRTFAMNAAWLTAVMLAVDLIAWTQTMLQHDIPPLAKAEPKPCATGSCTSRPAWSAADGDSGCASTGAGHGPRNSPEPSPAAPRFPNQQANQHPEPTTRSRRTRQPKLGGQPRPGHNTTTNRINPLAGTTRE